MRRGIRSAHGPGWAFCGRPPPPAVQAGRPPAGKCGVPAPWGCTRGIERDGESLDPPTSFQIHRSDQVPGIPLARARVYSFLLQVCRGRAMSCVGMRVAYSMPAKSPDEPRDGSAQPEPGFRAVAASRRPWTVNFSDNRRRGAG
jgi:hypothetical protein